VAIRINNDIKFGRIDFLVLNNDIDAIELKVWLNNTNPYMISYYNPKGQIANSTNSFINVINSNMLTNLIACGYFNAHNLLWENKQQIK